MPTFYNLPATALEPGMSTDDGQDFLAVTAGADGWVVGTVYTPRSDDPAQDAHNRGELESRLYKTDQRVDLAAFPDSQVDGSSLDEARITLVTPDTETT